MTAPYGSVIHEHFRRPRRRGTLAAPDVNAEGANPLCGDRLRLQLAIADGRVVDACFTADACAVCVAAASLLTSHLVGLTTAESLAIDEATVLRWLETDIPDARRRCALLPLETLRRGLGAG